MSVTDEVVRANRQYAQDFKLSDLPMPPARKLAIVTCMDAQLTVEQALGLKTGEAHIIRNAGGIVTEDALRSLLISHYLLGTQEFIVINHTDCGMLTFKDEELRTKLQSATGMVAVVPAAFHAFGNVEENVREQIQKLRVHPWIPKGVTIHGCIYHLKTIRLNEVTEKRRREQVKSDSFPGRLLSLPLVWAAVGLHRRRRECSMGYYRERPSITMALEKMLLRAATPGAHEIIVQSAARTCAQDRNHAGRPFLGHFRAYLYCDAIDDPRHESLDGLLLDEVAS
jgi:carbonic anhydrase